MRLAMRLSGHKNEDDAASSSDPREQESAEIIDLASRTAYPAVARGTGSSDGLGLAAGVVVVGLLGALTLWSMDAARTGSEAVQPAVSGEAVNVGESVPDPEVLAKDAEPVQAEVETPVFPSDLDFEPVLSGGPDVMPVDSRNPYDSPTMIFDASRSAAEALSEAIGVTDPTVAAPMVGDDLPGSAAAFASRVGGVGGARTQARPMTNPTTTVTQGTLIPAVLETAINTDVPGYVRAVVSRDVRSFDGRNVLVPRSSRLIGQYQSGVQQGQKRAYVIWTRLIRPDGASVSLASPGVSFDGTTGHEGEVDTHFFKRFGSAMLLSVVGSLGALSSSGASVVLGGAGQSAASAAVQQGSSISPTIRVRQGEPIRVFTARDLDFSSV